MKSLIETSAYHTAKWWSEQIAEPTTQDAGDAMINAFASMASRSALRPTRDQLDVFEVALADLIAEQLHLFSHVSVYVDYGPDGYLTQACEKAGIDPGSSIFPIKTASYSTLSTVEASRGYRAPKQTVWRATDEPEPAEKV